MHCISCYQNLKSQLVAFVCGEGPKNSSATAAVVQKILVDIEQKSCSQPFFRRFVQLTSESCIRRLIFRISYAFKLAGIWLCNGGIQASSAIKYSFLISRERVKIFIKNNFKQIIAYTLAWTIIIASSALLYNFTAVTLPLTIGFSCGLCFGGIIALLMVTAIDPNRKLDPNTAWDLVNAGIEKLDLNGTRQIVLAISVTLLLTASIHYPYALGALFGIFIGNQVITKIGQKRNLGCNIGDYECQVQNLQSQLDRLKLSIDHDTHN